MQTNYFSQNNKLRRSKEQPQLQHGQAAVEIALLLPLLLLILFGIVMVGFILYAHIQVSNAAREGARAGSLYRITHAQATQSPWTELEAVQQAVYDSNTGNTALGSLPINSSSFIVTRDVIVTLTQPDGSARALDNPQPGDLLTAQVTYSYTVPVLSSFLRVFPQPLVIRRNVMMEVQ